MKSKEKTNHSQREKSHSQSENAVILGTDTADSPSGVFSMKEIEGILKWIKEVREGSQKVIKIDLEKIIKEMKKGNYDNSSFAGLVQEVRDNERDDALLSLIERMLLDLLSY